MGEMADRGLPLLVAALLAGGLLAAAATTGAPAVETTFELRPVAAPPAAAPDPSAMSFGVQLQLDDGSQEAAFGVASGEGAKQFLWFNRFASPGPSTLEEIWVLFPGSANVSVGAPIQLAVFHDPDANPANGATLLSAFAATIQAADDTTFSVYPLPAPLALPSGGEVLLGVVSRFVSSGVTPPTNVASLDTTSAQGSSWFAVWNGDPPDPPSLPGDQLTTPVDPFLAGNWMIRGFGSPPSVLEIPALGPLGLAALAALLALVALPLLRRVAGDGGGSA